MRLYWRTVVRLPKRRILLIHLVRNPAPRPGKRPAVARELLAPEHARDPPCRSCVRFPFGALIQNDRCFLGFDHTEEGRELALIDRGLGHDRQNNRVKKIVAALVVLGLIGAATSASKHNTSSPTTTKTSPKIAAPRMNGGCTQGPIRVGDPFRFRLKITNPGPGRWDQLFIRVENVDNLVRNNLTSTYGIQRVAGGFQAGAPDPRRSVVLSGFYVARSAGRQTVDFTAWPTNSTTAASGSSCDIVIDP